MALHISRVALQVLYLERFGPPRAPNTLRELLGVLNVRAGDDETPRERKTLNLMGAAHIADAPGTRAIRIYAGADIVIEPTVTGTLHNYRPADFDDASIVAFSTGGAATITGFDAFSARRLEKLLINNGSHNVTVSHQSSSSLHDNRVIGAGNADVVLEPGGSAWLVRDAESTRWRATIISASGSVPDELINLDFEDPDNSHHVPFVNI